MEQMKDKPAQYACGLATAHLYRPKLLSAFKRCLYASPLAVLAGCAKHTAIAAEDAPGFFLGILHGLIALPALLGSLVLDVRVYAFPNNGFWYELGFCGGFVFGIGLLAVPVIPFIGGYLTRRH